MNAALRRPAPWIVAAVSLLVFLPGLRNGFVNWDDRVVLLENPYFRGLGWAQLRWMFSNFATGKYQPLSWLSFGLDYLLWGLAPAGYHFTALLVHAANALLLYLIAYRLLDDDLAAGFCALFWALHPLRVEAVSWATDRGDPLSGFFYLAAVLFYLRRELAWSCAAFVLSLMSKAAGVTLPAVLLLLDLYPLRRWRWGAWSTLGPVLAEKLPFAAAALLFGGIGYFGQSTTRAMVTLARFGLRDRLAQAAYAPAFYLAKTVFPAGLSPLYTLSPRLTPAPFALAAAFVVLLSAVLIARRRAAPWALAAWVYFLLALFPTIGLVKFGLAIASDRYTYLAAMGPALLAGLGARRLRPGWTRNAALTAVLLALSAVTVSQIGAWRDSITFWSRAVAVDPECYVCHKNLGDALTAAGRPEEGRGHVAEGMNLLAKARYEVGLAYYDSGDFGAAAQRLAEALEAVPDLPQVENELGLALYRQGRIAEAAFHFQRVVSAKPEFLEARANWAAALASQGIFGQARVQFKKVLIADPANAQALAGLRALDAPK